MPDKIVSEKLILVEGCDAKIFMINMLQIIGKENVFQVLDFGGISDLNRYIATLKKMDGFDLIKSILIVRDCESSATSAIQSVNTCLKNHGLIISNITPFRVYKNDIKIGLALFPGYDDDNKLIESGTLEDLCVAIIKDQTCLKTIEVYIQNFQDSYFKFRRLHKNRLHAMISFTNDHVGMKLGEAAKAKFYDFDHSRFLPFKEIIENLEKA